jgi:transcriptional/translational regulatory protein YebC/TACO1
MFTIMKMLKEFERKVVLRKLIAEALAAQVPRTTVENAVKNYSNVLDRIEALVEIREMRG